MVADNVGALVAWKLFGRAGKKLVVMEEEGVRYVARQLSGDSGAIWEEHVVHLYSRFLPKLIKGDVIVDVGGHIGTFAINTARKFGCRVISFEPDVESRKLFLANLELNKIEGVEVMGFAVAGKSGWAGFESESGYSMANGLTNKAGAKKVCCWTLDDVFKNLKITKCNFMKVDCEGAEYSIFDKAAKKTLDMVRALLVECHPGGSCGDLEKKLRKWGWTTKIHDFSKNPLVQRVTGNIKFLVATRR